MEELTTRGGDPGVGRESEARRKTILARAPLFAVLGSETLAEVASRATFVRVARRKTLFDQGDPTQAIWVIGSGRVRLSRAAPDGPEVAMGYRSASDLVGEEGLLGQGAGHTDRATALENVDAVRLSSRAVTRLLDAHAEAAIALARLVHERRAQAEARVHGLVSRSVVSRLAEFLIDARKRYGIPESRGALIGARFTHQEIAEWVGATRETITLTLGDWKRRGLVLFDHRRVVVIDEAKLQKLI